MNTTKEKPKSEVEAMSPSIETYTTLITLRQWAAVNDEGAFEQRLIEICIMYDIWLSGRWHWKWDAYKEKTRNNFIARTEGHVANLHANINNKTSMAELATIAVPTLAIRSERPTRFDLRMVELVAEAIPDCGFITLPDTEHMCPLTHPDLVAEAIDRHISQAG